MYNHFSVYWYLNMDLGKKLLEFGVFACFSADNKLGQGVTA